MSLVLNVNELCIWLARNGAEQHVSKCRGQGVKSPDAVVLWHYLGEGTLDRPLQGLGLDSAPLG